MLLWNNNIKMLKLKEKAVEKSFTRIHEATLEGAPKGSDKDGELFFHTFTGNRNSEYYPETKPFVDSARSHVNNE